MVGQVFLVCPVRLKYLMMPMGLVSQVGLGPRKTGKVS